MRTQRRTSCRRRINNFMAHKTQADHVDSTPA